MKKPKEYEKLARELFSKASSLEKFIYKYSKMFDKLTEREIAVLALVANELTDDLVAKNLRIGKTAVQNHRASIEKKLPIDNQSDYVKFALAFGLITF